MNYVILEKAKPYTRVKRGKLERVKGYSGKSKTEKPKVGDTRIRKIDEELAKKEQKQLKFIFNDIQSRFKNRLKKITPDVKIKWRFNKGSFSDWEEMYSEWKFWVPKENRSFPWIEWELRKKGEERYHSPKYHGYGSISFYPKSLEPDQKSMEKMSFKIGDSEFGTSLKNRGLYSAIFSALASARDKGWLEYRLYVHVDLGTKAWNKLAKKFKFPYIGNEKAKS